MKRKCVGEGIYGTPSGSENFDSTSKQLLGAILQMLDVKSWSVNTWLPALDWPQEWSIKNFHYNLTRNITSHGMKNLALHSLLRWKMIATNIRTISLLHWENVLFVVESGRVNTPFSVRRSRIAQPASSWLDDYFSWIDPAGKPACCRLMHARVEQNCTAVNITTNSTHPPPHLKCVNYTVPVSPPEFCNATGEVAGERGIWRHFRWSAFVGMAM